MESKEAEMEFEQRYQAMETRDESYTGRFFAAVTTTGIYCRPGCPARMPKRENVRFYRTTAAARSDGFRACLRATQTTPEASRDA
jgi:AraC family transcriptional regulator of adaptative response / DNA-3-methyladenine glycosylase II